MTLAKPVIAVGSLIPQPLNSLMALADSKVQGPDTIKGATIGVAGLPFEDAILQTIRQTQALFDLAEQKQASVRGQHAAIETDIQRLPADR